MQTESGVVSRSFLMIAIFATVLCLTAGTYAIVKDRALFLESQRSAAKSAASRYAAHIESQLFGMELVANRLATFASMSIDLSADALSDAADRLVEQHPAVLSVAIAPSLTVSHVSPQKGNERVVGLKYWQVPFQLPSIARAFREKSPVFHGPVNLVQGGRGYILRYPVFTPSSGGNGQDFWGIISIAMSESGLFGALDESPRAQAYDFALRELYPSGQVRSTLYGKPSLFDRSPVVVRVSALGGNWEIGALPKTGWKSVSPGSYWIAGTTLVTTMGIVGGLLLIRKSAAREKRAHDLLSHAVEAMGEGFALFDREDRLVMYNRRFAEQHGVKPGEIRLGARFSSLVRISAKMGNYSDAIGREEEWLAERRAAQLRGESTVHLMSDGRWLKVSQARTPDGFTVRFGSDVTRQIEAQHAAEAANRQKSEFLGNVTHELRTPLTIITGHASLIASDHPAPQITKLDEMLQETQPDLEAARELLAAYSTSLRKQGSRIEGAARHMLTMVNDLLDWARFEGGELQVEPAPIDATEAATACVEELSAQARRQGLELTCTGEGGMVAADPGRLKQVLYNLVGNALKFTKEGSITVSVKDEGPRVRFAVEDTGCGIRQEDLERIFERFQQVDGSDTRSHQGVGLGLSIARQLVRLHGGELTATSEVGQGSRFEFDLPAWSEDALEANPDSPAGAVACAETVAEAEANANANAA